MSSCLFFLTFNFTTIFFRLEIFHSKESLVSEGKTLYSLTLFSLFYQERIILHYLLDYFCDFAFPFSFLGHNFYFQTIFITNILMALPSAPPVPETAAPPSSPVLGPANSGINPQTAVAATSIPVSEASSSAYNEAIGLLDPIAPYQTAARSVSTHI